MYNSNNVAEIIKATAKSKNITIKKLLADTGLGKNTMSNMKTSMPTSDNLAKIADYLNCSVDYLLGRTNDSTPVNANSPIASVIGENGVREDRHQGSEPNKDRVALLEEMGIKINSNYLVNKNNEKIELLDNEYDFLIKSLESLRKITR